MLEHHEVWPGARQKSTNGSKEAYKEALKIARSKGFPRTGFWLEQENGDLTPHVRTKLFAQYFFLNDGDFEEFNESSDPAGFIRKYINDNYSNNELRVVLDELVYQCTGKRIIPSSHTAGTVPYEELVNAEQRILSLQDSHTARKVQQARAEGKLEAVNEVLGVPEVNRWSLLVNMKYQIEAQLKNIAQDD